MKNLVIISAPSGAGKTTICKALQKSDKAIKFSVSCTTREKRINEKDGVDYNFISKKEFINGINNGRFAEWEKVHDNNYYGTTLDTLTNSIQHNNLLLMELDVKGALSIINLYPNKTLSIFIKPPSLEELKLRLQNRGTETDKSIEKRLNRLDDELSYKSYFDYHILNDKVNKAVIEILSIIKHQNEGVYNGS